MYPAVRRLHRLEFHPAVTFFMLQLLISAEAEDRESKRRKS
jgi:hypothetical protein